MTYVLMTGINLAAFALGVLTGAELTYHHLSKAKWWLAYRQTYFHEHCPYCQLEVWGMAKDIDSGMRKHIEYCEERSVNV